MKMTAAVLTLSLTILLMSGAAQAAETPTVRVKVAVDKVVGILRDPALKGPAKTKERRTKILQAVSGVFDWEEMAKRSLGQYWRQRTPEEQKEFVSLFSDLLERSYINRIESYTDEKIIYDGEQVDAGYATVKSRLINKRKEEIPVDYKLIQKNNEWYVYDLVIEDVSLVNNYRIQFNKIIRSSSYAELVKKMKNKSESESFVTPGAE